LAVRPPVRGHRRRRSSPARPPRSCSGSYVYFVSEPSAPFQVSTRSITDHGPTTASCDRPKALPVVQKRPRVSPTNHVRSDRISARAAAGQSSAVLVAGDRPPGATAGPAVPKAWSSSDRRRRRSSPVDKPYSYEVDVRFARPMSETTRIRHPSSGETGPRRSRRAEAPCRTGVERPNAVRVRGPTPSPARTVESLWPTSRNGGSLHGSGGGGRAHR
jgi:hypothetical protein